MTQFTGGYTYEGIVGLERIVLCMVQLNVYGQTTGRRKDSDDRSILFPVVDKTEITR